MKRSILFCVAMLISMSVIAMEKLMSNVEYLGLTIEHLTEDDCLRWSCVNRKFSTVIMERYFRLNLNNKWHSNVLGCLLLKREPSKNKYLNLVEHFLKNGCDPNGYYEDPIYLLHEAVKRKDKKFARILLKHGANPYLEIWPVAFCSSFNAFHYARVGEDYSFESMECLPYGKGQEPGGWLLDLCQEVEGGKNIKNVII